MGSQFLNYFAFKFVYVYFQYQINILIAIKVPYIFLLTQQKLLNLSNISFGNRLGKSHNRFIIIQYYSLFPNPTSLTCTLFRLVILLNHQTPSYEVMQIITEYLEALMFLQIDKLTCRCKVSEVFLIYAIYTKPSTYQISIIQFLLSNMLTNKSQFFWVYAYRTIYSISNYYNLQFTLFQYQIWFNLFQIIQYQHIFCIEFADQLLSFSNIVRLFINLIKQIFIYYSFYSSSINIIFISMLENNGTKQVSQATVLIMIWKVIEAQRQRGQDSTMQCLLNEEKVLHLSMLCLQRKTIKAVPFDLSQQIINFVLKINKITMENFKQENQNMDLKLMTKAVDLLMTPQIGKYISTPKSLGSIKILTFNNLACIYKKKKKFGLAVKAVSYAIQIQQYLFKNDEKGEKYQIIQTYLNKAAILSEMKKHEKAIQQIIKAKKIVDMIQKQVGKQANETQNEQQKKRIEQKRYYGLYMKMVINYNMGVQKEHMKLNQTAAEYYKTGRKLAVTISNSYMIKKFDAILNKITTVR